MAKSSITPGAGVKTEGQENLPATVPQTSGAIVPANDGAKYDDANRDVIIPRIGLVNNVGPLWKKFPKNTGSFVFEERVLLGETAEVIALSLRKFYVEIRRDGKDLKYGDGIMAKTFTSANAANLAGYAIDFDSNWPNKVQEAGDVLFLIAGPADDPAGAFYIEVDGKHYAPALQTFRRGGFREAWKLINTTKVRQEAQKKPLHGTVFTLSSKLVENAAKQQAWFEPRVAIARKVSPEGIAAIESAASSFLSKAAASAPSTE